ncbi:MAG: HlyD family secretion protein [Polyangiaceae bacterium]
MDAARADLALIAAGTRREDVMAATDDLKGALANEDLLRSDAERAGTLWQGAALPKAAADKATTDLDSATARRKALEARLAALKHGARPEEIARANARVGQAVAALGLEEARLTHYVVRATDPGEVIDVTVKPGEFAAVGTAMVTLADTGHPYVDVFVAEGALRGIRVGTKASVRVDAASAPLSGAVEHVAPEAEYTPKFVFSERERPNIMFRVRVRISDHERALHAGVPAFARIVR